MRDSAASAPRNIAEGFGSTFDGVNPTNGYHPLWLVAILPFFYALTETHNHLRDGRERGYFTAADQSRRALLAARAAIATTRLIRYLRSLKSPGTRS